MAGPMLIRCTQKLLKASSIKPEEVEIEPEQLFGEWYATTVSLPFPGRIVVMFTSASTLLTVLAPGRVLRTTVPVFRQRLASLLHRLHLPPEWRDRQLEPLGGVSFAAARDRRVLGCVNHLGHILQGDSEFLFPAGDIDLDRLEMRLAEVPMKQPLESPDQPIDLEAAQWRLERLSRAK